MFSIKVGDKAAFKPIQAGVIIATTSMLLLHEQFLYTKKWDFFLPGRVNQDCLENFFGTVRASQAKPSALDFKNTIKSLSVCQYMKNLKEGSYDRDDCSYMTEFLEIVNQAPKEQPFTTTSLPECPMWVLNQINNSKLVKYELMTLYNTAGYIVNTIIKNNFKKCNLCVETLGSYVPVKSEYSRFQMLKQFKGIGHQESNKLFYVNENTFCFFRKLENIFRYFADLNLLFTGNIKDHLVIQMLRIPEIFPACHSIQKRLITNFVVFRLRIYGKRKIRNGMTNFASNSMNEQSLV